MIIKKRKKTNQSFPKFCVGRKRANKHDKTISKTFARQIIWFNYPAMRKNDLL